MPWFTIMSAQNPFECLTSRLAGLRETIFRSCAGNYCSDFEMGKLDKPEGK